MDIKHLERTIGILRDDKVFICYKDESHIFRKHDSIGFSWSVLKKLHDLNCYKMVIILGHKDGTTEKLISNPDYFIDNGILYKDGINDWQRHIPLEKLRVKEIQREVRA